MLRAQIHLRAIAERTLLPSTLASFGIGKGQVLHFTSCKVTSHSKELLLH